MEGTNELERVIGWKRTLSFALPSIITMLLISSYNMVDGAFVSNLISTDALASINILMPVASIISGAGFMLATGGSAYIANLLGQGKKEKACGSFTTLILFTVGLSLSFTILGLIFIEPLVSMLGADERLFGYAVTYGRTYLFFTVFLVLQFICTQLLIASGHPTMSLILSATGGATNIVLDWVFIGVLDMGLSGAAIASGCGSLIPSLVSIAFFTRKDVPIHFMTPLKDVRVITSSCSNGISEMASELSGGITIFLYNMVMMKYIGADGVSAITIMMYAQFLAIAVIIGYSNGVAPVMSYNHGKQDHGRMNGLFRTSLMFVMVMSVAIFAFMEMFGENVIGVFANDSESVMRIATDGARIFSFAFLFMGMNIYASSLFTSLSNGLVSAVISITRSVLLLSPLIVLFPYLFGIDSVWLAVPVTELVTMMLSVFLILRLGRGYGFLKSKQSQ